ncbi:DUF1826 domain-containing protein [Tropicibacter sp. Alg240-R139]|uniref:DUF1826 domain-containing protein n=1 Tax=Tropicibacter sp. Alg240-R139 TaxID=2305991 RepID=UPI0013E03D9C|nr:DUF1826 domain-containing protein [Tropicibacter sp. Alg240-R139]
MNIAAPVFADQPAGVRVVSDARGLDSFRDPSCAAAIWGREVPSNVALWLDALDAKALPDGRVVLHVQAIRDTVLHLCDIAGTPDGPHREWLIDDIADLAQRFASLMNADYVRLRLQAVTTNACRKFHLDAITGRLVCTYRGTGTQYGTSVRREDPVHIHTAPTCAPILLRGSLWPPEPDAGLLHRSPPIDGTGETRLLLVLDPIFDLDEAE